MTDDAVLESPPAGHNAQSDIGYSQFRALANSIPNLAWMADKDGWVSWYNKRWYDYTGTTPEEMIGWGWQSVHHPDVLPEMLERWTHSLRTGEPFEMIFPLRRGSDGSYRIFMTRAEPLSEGGQIVGWFGTNTDVTEHERTRERLQLVINELNHRVKNTLAVVQSLAMSSFGKSDPEAYEKFEGRLLSLSGVHDLLTRDSWDRTSLSLVIQTAIESFGASRFEIHGEDVRVEPRIASGLAMTIHELCTNAAKYGALSMPGGSVVIRWFVGTRGEGAELCLEWRERGGPSVSQPQASGFGLRLIRKALAGETGASVDHRFNQDGVCCTLKLPISPAKDDR